jgi:cob(I)alamin adenosyltransferase
MKYAFGSGDDGRTNIYNRRISKTDQIIKAVGDIDELSAHIGHAVSCADDDRIIKTLEEIEYDLYVTSAELAGYKGTAAKKISANDVKRLEGWITEYSRDLDEMREFIYPNGSMSATEINICRTIARRAEISILEIGMDDKDITGYINRLSSLLFVMFRYANKKGGHKEERYRL